jgi:hypothetical protein
LTLALELLKIRVQAASVGTGMGWRQRRWRDEARDYIFLDGTEEREILIARIAAVRRAVGQVVKSVPEDLWYTPRYHGWSPAAMLGHLNLRDNLSLLLLRSTLLGLRFKLSASQLDQLNNFSTRLFQKRLVASSLRSMERNQDRIADFVMHLPINKFRFRFIIRGRRPSRPSNAACRNYSSFTGRIISRRCAR